MRPALLALLFALSAAAQAPKAELRLVESSESLTGRHERYRQYIDGIEVFGRDVVLERGPDQQIREVRGRTIEGASLPAPQIDERRAREVVPLQRIERVDRIILGDDGPLRDTWRVIGRTHPLEPYACFVDAQSGAIVRTIPLFANAPARVFNPNPVTSLNDPNLQDQDDSPAAVPAAAYFDVDLPGLPASGPLVGPNVSIVDLQPPTREATNVSQPMLFDRSAAGFEEVMAYYHLDRSQRYLQSLGYVGAKRIINRSIAVDAHAASGADNSYYIGELGGGGSLYFGDGGVDDAEDADILLHEYGHALQDSIADGAFFSTPGSQAAALGEGFGDYWAFSYGYSASVQTGRDPFCVGDWDARCGGAPSSSCGYAAGADCLRRVDSTKTMDDYIVGEQRGTEHRNGEIWSSALRRVFLSLLAQHGTEEGRRISDRIVIESHFGLATTPTFKLLATRMVDADRVLYGGQHESAICSSMVLAKIFAGGECGSGRRGDLTLLQSVERDRAIPDNDAVGITSSRVVTSSRVIERIYVQVRINHPYRGDLRIVLIAPDGRTVLLDEPGADAGTGIVATYGLDVEPVQSLDILRGMPAAGEWRLRVSDERGRDTGTLVSWGLLIRYQGDESFSARPSSSAGSIIIPVTAKAAGAAGTNFVTDVRIFNAGPAATLTVVFTPSGAGGADRFAAVRVEIEPGQTLALDDIVGSFFGTSGTGSVEVQGADSSIVASSRTYNQLGDRTYGQFIGAVAEGGLTVAGTGALHIPHVRNTTDFRTNIGITNTTGGSGTARVELFDAGGTLTDSRDEVLGPYGHSQFAVLTGRTVDLARAKVRVISGTLTVAAYGSVVDNFSGDSIYIPGATAPAAPRVLRLPVVARAPGAVGTDWRSDVVIANVTTQPRQTSLTYLASDGSSMIQTQLSLAAGESRFIGDVLGSVFNLSSARGQLEIGSSGLIVASRTWTPGEGGTFGQYIGGFDPALGLRSGPKHSIQVQNSSTFRTNIGISEVAGASVVVRVRLFDGGGAQLFSRTYSLEPNRQLQFGLTAEGAPEVSNGRVSFEVLDGTGAIVGYASVIDNRSGDPIFIPAQ